MKKKLSAAFIILPAALCIALVLFFLPRGSSAPADTVSLWYISGSCSDSALNRLVSDYNARAGKGAAHVSLRAFEDEAALGSAFGSGLPDLLLCSHVKAAQLSSRSVLGSVSGVDAAWTAPVRAVSGTGDYFFPIGAAVPVLLSDASACENAAFSSLEALTGTAQAYTAASGKPFFAVDSYYDLFCCALSSLGAESPGSPDPGSPEYIRVYNALALCAYDGSLANTADCAGLCVAQGLLPCAVVGSSELPLLFKSGLSVSALPLPESGRGSYYALLTGLAVIDGGRASAASDFLRWLFAGGRALALSLDSGLVPACGGEADSAPSGWSGLLLSLRDGGLLLYPTADTCPANSAAGFETHLRRVLDLIS